MSYFIKAVKTFEGFAGAKIPQDPTNQAEFEALEPACTDRDYVWEGTAPTWAEVEAKMNELRAADEAKVATKRSAYEKLGLTEAEIAAIL